MSFEVKKEKVRIDKTLSQQSPQVMVDCDVIVPDRKSDVLKVLQVDAGISITSRELREGIVSIGGKIDYAILYLSEDANTVESILISQPYNHMEEIVQAGPGMHCFVDSDISHVEFSLVNSRKIAIKTIADLSIDVIDKMEIDVMSEIEDEGLQYKTTAFKAVETLVGVNRKISVSDRLSVPSGKQTIDEILKFDVAIYNRDVKIINNKVIVKGDVVVNTLYVPEEDGGITYMEHSVPFTEILDVEGIDESLRSDVRLRVCDKSLGVAADDDNDKRVLEMSVTIDVDIRASRIDNVQAVSDCYAVGGEIETANKYMEVDQISDVVSIAHTLRDIVKFADDIPRATHIYNVIAKPYVTSALVEGGRIILEGTLDTYVLYISENADSPVYTYKYELPFTISEDAAGSDSASSTVQARLQLEHLSFNINAAGEVEVRAFVSGKAEVGSVSGINVVCEITQSEVETAEYPSLVMCFVEKDENLWDIAKHYRVRQSDIMQANKMETQTLQEGTGLIIPTK